jgi:methylated-DNA-protein-cysteine methyltransferase related protein
MTGQRTEQVGDSFRERVYAAVRAVPRGRVASYGAIAAAIGQPRAARAVGHALRALGQDAGQDNHRNCGQDAGQNAPGDTGRDVGQNTHGDCGQERSPEAEPVPWWRVVNAVGGIAVRGAFHEAAVQRALLEGEGVTFSGVGRIDWARYGWSGADGAEGAEGAVHAEAAEGAVHAEAAEGAECAEAHG